MDLPAHQLTMTVLMTPDTANFAGNVHGGTILKLLDQVAYACASRYAGRYVVTLSVDQVMFRQPMHVGELVTFLATVNYTGTSSMEVGIKVVAEDIRSQATRHVNSCFFTMVAVDDERKPGGGHAAGARHRRRASAATPRRSRASSCARSSSSARPGRSRGRREPRLPRRSRPARFPGSIRRRRRAARRFRSSAPRSSIHGAADPPNDGRSPGRLPGSASRRRGRARGPAGRPPPARSGQR